MDIQVSFAPKPKVIEGATVGFTESAAKKVKALVEEENNPNLKLRVSVDGGGCSGFQYAFAFDENVSTDDTVVEKSGATVIVDVTSMQYLNGSEVDYLEGLEGARFVVNNPNATSTCGCGSSFSVSL
ncbi:Iron-sulfur cluster insertion protein ErpA [hydrothermal vent metagenome]|uniref:Iron-sulfur cluster insertion protein ErpA n=1 Tax=hydrothermal vent metagenome TaxID=652676 RepID=A0A3B0W4B4_9ZZZZ